MKNTMVLTVGVMEIFKIFAMQDSISLELNHLTEFSRVSEKIFYGITADSVDHWDIP